MSTAEAANPTSPEIEKFNDLLTTSLKESEDFHAITGTFEEAFARPDVQEQAGKDIRGRIQNVQDLKEIFAKIGMSFIGFDNANVPDEGSQALKLSPRWCEFEERFHAIVDKSCDEVCAASVFMQVYSRTILTDVNAEDRATLGEELRSFMSKLDAKAADAFNVRAESTRLAEDVRAYIPVIEEALALARSRLTVDADSTKAMLSSLHEKLRQIQHNMNSIGTTCAAHLAAGAGAAGLAIGTLSPAAIFIAAASIYNAIGTDVDASIQAKEMAELERAIKQCDANMDKITAKEQILARHQADLSTIKMDIIRLVTKLDMIAMGDLWSSLKSDMHDLDTQLSLSVDPNMPLESRLLRQIKASRELYAFLATLLEMYVKGVGVRE
ncbi:hypothetical protein PYCCODRAFT_1462983 [Trametes coccinea BRFM310]|uniref:Uncharacterized protein n=1 Tax=Trametes coccinea (strain BRFM310) TaxID=1353009 RepID=A0A1Y2J979_TRAC3|nr:hypothetical protein PYCCODRAFT_1462983 [Trametes coccinea BRFM310]